MDTQTSVSSATFRYQGGGSRVRRESRVFTMWAWISTPGMGPVGVGNVSRLSAKLAPTRTMRSRKGLSWSGTVPARASCTSGSLGNVVKAPAGPVKSTRHGRAASWLTGVSVGPASAPDASRRGSGIAPPSPASRFASSAGGSPVDAASVASDSAGSHPPPARGRTGVKRRTMPSAPIGALAKPTSPASSGAKGGSRV